MFPRMISVICLLNTRPSNETTELSNEIYFVIALFLFLDDIRLERLDGNFETVTRRSNNISFASYARNSKHTNVYLKDN